MSERRSVGTAQAADAAEPARLRRVDARRNLESILQAARILLPEHPNASMQEIASEAGVHRATVHRHFASRDDLVAAVRMRAVSASLQAVEDTLADDTAGGAAAFEAVTEAVLTSGNTYRLYRFTTWLDNDTQVLGEKIAAHITPLVRAAQEKGEMRSDLSTDEVLLTWGGLISSVLPQIADQKMTPASAAALIRRIVSPSS